MYVHFEIWFPKKRTITFFWSKLSYLHQKDPILHVATTFSLTHSLTPSTLAVGHWWWLAKDVCPSCCFQLHWLHSLCHLLVDLSRSSWGVLWILLLALVATWLALTLYTLQPFYNVLQMYTCILLILLTFSLKQGETRTSHGPIPHPLKIQSVINEKNNIEICENIYG